MNSLSQWWHEFSRRWPLDPSISAEQLSAHQPAWRLRRVAHAWVARRDSVFKDLLKERKSLEAKCRKAAAELSEAVSAVRRFGFRRDYHPAIDARDVSFANRRELRARAIKPSRTVPGARAVLDWCETWDVRLGEFERDALVVPPVQSIGPVAGLSYRYRRFGPWFFDLPEGADLREQPGAMWHRGTHFVKDVVAWLHAEVCLSPWTAAYVLDRLLSEGSLGKYLSVESAHTPRGKNARDTVLLRMERDLDAWLVQLAEPYEAWLFGKCGAYGELYISAFPPWARRPSWPDRSWCGSVGEPEPSSLTGTVWFVAYLLDTISGAEPSPDGVQVKGKRKNKAWQPKAFKILTNPRHEGITDSMLAEMVGVNRSTISRDPAMKRARVTQRELMKGRRFDDGTVDAVVEEE